MKRSRMLHAVLLLAVTGVLAGCGERANGQANQPRTPPAVPVTVAAVVRKPTPVQLKAIGAVEAVSSITMKSRVEGSIVQVHFREGQDVKKGDPLFTIDPRPFEAALRQAEANLARSRAQARQAEANLARDEARARQSEANVARSMAQAKNARVQADRYVELVKRGLVSQEQGDQYRTAAETFEAGLRADQADLQSVQEAIQADRAAIQSAQSTIRSDQAVVENARLQLGYTVIASPIDGRTGSLAAYQGNMVKANDTVLVTINQLLPINVAFSVPEQELPRIRRYMAAGSLRVAAVLPGEAEGAVEGRITFVDNAVDRTTGTIRLKGTFDNQQHRLWPGQFVDVVLTLAVEPDAVVAPASAVQMGQDGQYVFVVKPDMTVESRAITLSRTIGSEAVIARGLAAGETVVTDGQLRLVPGAKVQVRTEATPARPAS